MKTRWAVRLLLAAVAFLAAVALVLRTEAAGRTVCAQGRRLLANALGAEVEIASCRVDPLTARLTLEGLRIGAGDGALRGVEVRRVSVRLSPWRSLAGALALEELELDEPSVELALGAGPDDDEPAEDGCLAPLRRIRLGGATVRDGRVLLRLPGEGAVQLSGATVDLERRAGGYDVKVGVAGSLEGLRPALTLDRLSADVRLDPGAEALEVRAVEAVLPQGTVIVSGEVRRLCRPELALVATARAGVEGLLALAADDPAAAPPGTGVVETTVALEGPADAAKLRGSLSLRQAVLDGYEIGELFATFNLAGDALTVEDLLWPIEGGSARVKAKLKLAAPYPVEAEVRTERLEFPRLLARLTIPDTPVVMTIDSQHRLAGKLGDGFELAGESSIGVRGFHVRSEPWHAARGRTIVEVPGEGRIETPVRIDAEGVHLPAAKITFGPGSALDVDAFLGFSEESGLDLRPRGRIDLAHVANRVAGLPMGGAGTVEARIAGPYGEPVITGEVRLSEARLFSAQLGALAAKVRSEPSRGTLDFDDLDGRFRETAYAGAVKLRFDDPSTLDAAVTFRAGGRLDDAFAATAGLVEPLAWLRERLGGTIASGRARIHGPFERLDAEGELRAVDGTLLDRPYDELAATVRMEKGELLRSENLALRRGEGTATAVAELHFGVPGGPTLGAAIDARGLPVRELFGELGETADLQGGVGGNLHFSGPVDALALSGELHGSALSAAGVALPVARLSLETQGGEVIVRGPICGAGRLVGALRLHGGLPFDASFDLDVADLARYLPADAGIGGAVKGVLEARGELGDLGATAGAVHLERLALAIGDYRVENQGEVQASYAGSAFVLYGLTAKGENTELTLYGNRSADGLLDIQAQGTVDARLVDTLLPEIEHASGVVELRASLGGTGARPVLVGSASVHRGAFRVTALPLAVEKLEGNLAFSQNRVIVEEASLVANGGRARLRGAVGIRSWSPSTLDLAAEVERASWRLPEDFPAVVSGRLQLQGAWPDALALTGTVDVDRLRYARELDLEALVLDFSRKVRQPPEAGAREWLRLDLDLVGGPDMRIENNLLRARLQFVAPPGARQGRLKLVGTNVAVGLLGSVEIVEGFAFFRGNEYRLQQGVVGFGHRDRIDPDVDFTAETDVREYRVVVHGHGKLAAEGGTGFQLQLGSDPPLPQADVLTLLTFGITSRDPNAGANAAAGAGVAAEALWKVSGLDDQVRSWLPDSPILKDPNLTVTSQYSEITGQLEPTALFEAKLIDERLRLKASTPFATAKGRRASAEYRVDEHLSGQVVWENEETGYDAGDLGLDLKLRWEWE